MATASEKNSISELLDEILGLNHSRNQRINSALDEILNANSVLNINENINLISDDVLILARTKMNNQHICVGGYSLQQKRYVRLLTLDEQNLDETEPYQIGEVYQIKYQERPNIILPHREDVCVHFSEFKRKMSWNELIQILNAISVSNIHIKDLFNGLLSWEHGKGFLAYGAGIPTNSVTVVQLNHDLFLYQENRFRWLENNNVFSVKYVGTSDIGALRKIVAGRYLRFSLARWWDNQGIYPIKRAYLQLSAIY